MTGAGHGGIAVSVVTIDEHVFSIKLTFEFAFDQTYLSGIIRAVHREFRPVVRCIILKFCTIKEAHAALADEDYKMKSPSVKVAASVCSPGENMKRWSAIIGVAGASFVTKAHAKAANHPIKAVPTLSRPA